MTIKNNKMTQTILFSALLLTVIVSVSQPNLVWAHHADYMIPMTSVYKQIEQLQDEVSDIRTEISNMNQK